MKKYIIIVVAVLIISVFIYRTHVPEIIQNKIHNGMKFSDVLTIFNNSFVKPYACIWISMDTKKTKTTRGCNLSKNNFLDRDSTGSFFVIIIFRSLDLSSSFRVYFNKNKKVIKVTKVKDYF